MNISKIVEEQLTSKAGFSYSYKDHSVEVFDHGHLCRTVLRVNPNAFIKAIINKAIELTGSKDKLAVALLKNYEICQVLYKDNTLIFNCHSLTSSGATMRLTYYDSENVLNESVVLDAVKDYIIHFGTIKFRNLR